MNNETSSGPVGGERSRDSASIRASSLNMPSIPAAHECTAPRLRLGRRQTIHKNSQFQYVYRRGRFCAARQFAINYLPGKSTRVGISVSRKVGKSVVRSRVKRLIREAFRLSMPRIKPGQYVISARALAAEADFHTINKSLNYLLRRANLFTQDHD